MTCKIICPVKDNKVIVTLPPDFINKKRVTVYVDDQIDAKFQKLEFMKVASNDPLFLADIKETQHDFDSIDHETL